MGIKEIKKNKENIRNKTDIKNREIIKFKNYYIGKNGLTNNKKEGDGKTPLGIFKLGITFGTHSPVEIYNEIKMDKKIKYIQITPNLYWVDDSNSKYYNQLVDIEKTKKDWNSAEHLIAYSKQYEYAIEMKTNPNNIPGKGSALFIHCEVRKINLRVYCNK